MVCHRVAKVRVLDFDFLPEAGVAVSRVTSRPQSPRPDLGIDLFHDLAEIGCGESLEGSVVAILPESHNKKERLKNVVEVLFNIFC